METPHLANKAVWGFGALWALSAASSIATGSGWRAQVRVKSGRRGAKVPSGEQGR